MSTVFRPVRFPPLLRSSLVVFWLTSPQVAWAGDYFVATTGSDNNPGSESQPFKTVRKASEVATSPGDTVYVRGGLYGGGWDAHLSPQASGAAGNPITFKAYPGELPILDGSELGEDGSAVEPTEAVVSHIRVEGLVAQNWPDSGFSNGWDHASSDIEIIHCIADGNGVNGIAFNKASNVRIEGNITLHNGDQQPSWSSGVSLYTAGGTNLVKGNVSFENIDISTNRSDGSGFILDEGSAGAQFINNIAFRNGGSCIRLTKSSDGQLINNTCIQNGQDSNVNYNDEFYISDSTSTQGALVINNALWPGKQAFGGMSVASNSNNVTLTSGASFVSSTGALDFHLAGSASQLIDQGTASNAPTDDIGFDFKCIKQQSGLGHWWQYAIDYAYVEAAGGVAGCFRPGIRSGSIDIGAYESGAPATGCATDSECNDTDACTADACGAAGQCTHLPIEGCCLTDADCVDTDQCTIDVCDIASSLCSNAVDPMCGENASGQFSVDADTGYTQVCDWHGFHWSAAGPSTAGVNGTISSIEPGTDLCYTGVVAAQENFGGYAMLGININQESGSDTEALNTVPAGDGLNVSVTNTNATPLRVQLQDAPDADGKSDSWCVEVVGSGGFYQWSDFNTTCWAADDGEAYALQPINVIAIMVAGNDVDDRAFNFCLNQVSPSGAECSVTATDTANTGNTDTMTVDTTATPSSDPTATTADPTATPPTTPAPPSAPTATGVTDPSVPVATQSCADVLTECSGLCVDTTSDANNCGTCAVQCPVGQVCSESQCSATCAPGQWQCGQSCADISLSVLHCGGCDQACLGGQTCSSGICVGQPTGGAVTAPVTPVVVAPAKAANASCGCRVVGTNTSEQGGRPGLPAVGVALLAGLAWIRRWRHSA